MSTIPGTNGGGPTAVLREKREHVRLDRMGGERNRAKEAGARLVWFDTAGLGTPLDGDRLLERVVNAAYTGVVLYPDNAAALAPVLPARFLRVFHAEKVEDLARLSSLPGESAGVVVASPHLAVLAKAAQAGHPTCYRAFVDDGASLQQAVGEGHRHAYLMVRFRDPTNIPLELLIATLQGTRTGLVKEISAADVDDAVVTLGVMEVGADGVAFSPRSHEVLADFLGRLRRMERAAIALDVATVVRCAPIGMGVRSCIDTTTLFSETEGILVGSTSQGAILCCPEVFFLPYMELRPFRVNAGAVHSYVYTFGDRTDYMTELRAGSPVMVVDRTGVTRRASVGRMKTEVRPLRLIEAELGGGERVNVILQDDWHVRIYSDDARPLNITELRPGDKVLAHLASPGRHVGIKVDEHIVET
jgi:3-amino-4-hydroxybenzoic acid synthase